ncbi:MAG: hydantoinase/oxoprolinase family protein, partial [Chloroflexi bacterium]|nr:hydantoinase/oxoprolinase family protein [Chloroflexota bacterium]
EPTVTDADLVLGYLNPDYFLGGEMQLDLAGATSAIQRGVAEPLNVSAPEAARGVYEVVNENMANAAGVKAAEKGVDLRDYTLLAFGGAAPAHAWDVARRLYMRRVMVPPAAGVLSALGCLLSPLSFDFVFGYLHELDHVRWDRVNSAYADLERQGRRWLAEAGAGDEIGVHRLADMRYLGQRYEVSFPLPTSGPLGAEHLPAIKETFYEAYRQQYGREIHEVPVEAVSWRLTVVGPRPFAGEWSPRLIGNEGGTSGSGGAGPKGRRPVYFPGAGGYLDCAVYDRRALAPGVRLDGPAIVEDRESTTVVPPDAWADVDELNSLVIELGR